MCTGRRNGALTSAGTNASTQAIYPFMSAVPRPNSLPSRSVSVNGGRLQGCPSTGTTSVCPDSTIPGSSTGPMLANRLALLRCAL